METNTGKKVFVGNLPWKYTSEDLQKLFGEYGAVAARVIMDRESGRSRGFGFVELESPDHINAVMEGLNGHEIDGRPLRIAEAQDNPRS
jgi:RNA recognition motif-containing protein